MESLVFDKFTISLVNVQALLGDVTLSTLMSLANRGDTSHCHLLTPMNMNFYVEQSILPAALNMTDFKLVAHLPDITLQFSDTKVMQLILFGEAFGDSFRVMSQDEKSQIDIFVGYLQQMLFSSPFVTEDLYTRNFALRLLAEQAGEGEQAIGNIAKAHQTVLTREELLRLLPDIQMEIIGVVNNFEVHFENEGYIASPFLARPNIAPPDPFCLLSTKLPYTKLISLYLSDINANYLLRTFDTKFLVTMGAVYLKNWICDNRRMLASDKGAHRPFLALEYISVDPSSPESIEVYHGCPVNAKVAIHSLKFSIDPETPAVLMNAIQLMGHEIATGISAVRGKSMGNDLLEPLETDLEAVVTSAPIPEATPEPVTSPVRRQSTGGGHAATFHLDFSIQELTVRLIELQGSALMVRLRDLKGELALTGTGMVVAGGIRDFGFSSVPASAEGISLIETHSGSFLTFTYKSHSRTSLTYPGYDILLRATIAPLTLVYLPDTVADLVTFSNRYYDLHRRIKESSTLIKRELPWQNKVNWRDSLTKVRLEVDIRRPHVAVVTSRHSLHGLFMEVEHIRIRNKFRTVPSGESDIEENSVLVTGFHANMFSQDTGGIAAWLSAKTRITTQELVSNLNATLRVRRNLNADYLGAPWIEISGSVSGFDAVLSHSRLLHLLPIISALGWWGNYVEVDVEKEISPLNEVATLEAAPPSSDARGAIPSKTMPNPHAWFVDITLNVLAVRIVLERELAGPLTRGEPLGFVVLDQVEVRLAQMMNSAMLVEVFSTKVQGEDARRHASSAVKTLLTTDTLFLSYFTFPEKNSLSISLTSYSPRISVIPDFWLEAAEAFYLSSIPTAQPNPLDAPPVEWEYDTKLLAMGTSLLFHADPNIATGDGIVLDIDLVEVGSKGLSSGLRVGNLQASSCQHGFIKETRVSLAKKIGVQVKNTVSKVSQEVEVAITPVDLLLTYRDLKLAIQIANHLEAAMSNSTFLFPSPKVGGYGLDQFAITHLDRAPTSEEEEDELFLLDDDESGSVTTSQSALRLPSATPNDPSIPKGQTTVSPQLLEPPTTTADSISSAEKDMMVGAQQHDASPHATMERARLSSFSLLFAVADPFPPKLVESYRWQRHGGRC